MKISRQKVIQIVITIVLIITIAWAVWTFAPNFNLEKRGQAGDFIGGIFSALSFAIITYTLIIQNKQLKSDRDFADFMSLIHLKSTVVNGLSINDLNGVSCFPDYIRKMQYMEGVGEVQEQFPELENYMKIIESIEEFFLKSSNARFKRIYNATLTTKELDAIELYSKLPNKT